MGKLSSVEMRNTARRNRESLKQKMRWRTMHLTMKDREDTKPSGAAHATRAS